MSVSSTLYYKVTGSSLKWTNDLNKLYESLSHQIVLQSCQTWKTNVIRSKLINIYDYFLLFNHIGKCHSARQLIHILVGIAGCGVIEASGTKHDKKNI